MIKVSWDGEMWVAETPRCVLRCSDKQFLEECIDAYEDYEASLPAKPVAHELPILRDMRVHRVNHL